VFYGWRIVVAGLAIETITLGVFVQAYGAYVVALRAEFGWSITLLSLGFAFTRVAHGLLGPIQGLLVDRFGPRRIVSFGLVVLAIGLLLFSQVSGVETFFASLLFIAVGGRLCGFHSLAIAVVNWFDRRRSTALGLLSMGLAASAVLLPAVSVGFALGGWRITAVLSAAAVLVIALPIAQVLRHHPAASGLVPDGRVVSGDADARNAAGRELTVREALGAPRFWYLSLGHACAAAVTNAVIVHLVPYLTGSLSFTLAEASGLIVALSILMAIGTLSGGAAGDRVSRRHLLVASMAANVLAVILLGFATTAWALASFALLYGLTVGVRDPLMPAIRADFFGLRSFGAIGGMSSLFTMFGMVGGPLVAGIGYDATGSYTLGFLGVAAIGAVGAALFVLASVERTRIPAFAR
jgi:MFS family permease